MIARCLLLFYLEYYTGDVIRKKNYIVGKRKYEFLKLYLMGGQGEERSDARPCQSDSE